MFQFSNKFITSKQLKDLTKVIGAIVEYLTKKNTIDKEYDSNFDN